MEINVNRKKDHWSENNTVPDIGFNEETELFHCQTAGCAATAKYKYNNIVKKFEIMLLCHQESKKVADNKIYKAYEKDFLKFQTVIEILNSFMLRIIMMVLQKR